MDTSLDLTQVAHGDPWSAQFCSELAGWTLALILVRTLPALLWALAAPASTRSLRLAVLMLLGAGGAFAARYSAAGIAELPYAALGLAYFGAIAFAAFRVGARMQRIRISGPAMFALCAFLCVLLPCALLRWPEANAVRLMGFELTFALYSYLAEARERPRRLGMSDTLFFLIVNPTLVLPESGARVAPPGLNRAGLLRLLFGAATLAASVIAASAYYTFGPLNDWLERHAELPFGSWAAFVFVYATQGAALYFVHSGTASVQIAVMQWLGWQVPERYRWPILATSPVDFWQRWNTYLGSWLRRYVFMPTTLRWRRAYRRTSPLITQGGAAVATFCIAGLLHDLANYPANFRFTVSWTLAFTAVGVIVLLWLGAEMASRRVRRALQSRTRRAFGAWLVPIGYVFNVQHLTLMFWIITPDIDGRMNTSLGALLGLDRLGF